MGCKSFRDDKKRLDDLISWSVTHNLVEKEGQAVIAYTHQSFQEYLAAIYLKNRLCMDNRINQDILEECLEYRRWDETVVFTVGLLEKETAKVLINTIWRYDLYLAGSCLGEYKGLRSEFKGLIDELLKNIKNEEARHVLIKISEPVLIEKLIALFNTFAGGDAADVLGKIGSEKAVDPLIKFFNDKDADTDVRRRAADVLGKITKKLKEEEQDKLFARIYSLKFDINLKDSLITEIKNVTARRFIKISKLARKQMPE
ncbi:MAG: hypothetical protein FJ264_17980 [Planctomycetes bacterium]|nr:hypothetical protein [Planctomycetota bacterium]